MPENHLSSLRLRGGAALLLAGVVALSGIGLPSAAFAETPAVGDDALQVEAHAETAPTPIITVQPEDRAVEAGQVAEFTVAAEHAAVFRWQRATEVFAEHPELPEAWVDLDPDEVPSALEATLRISDAAAAHAGSYRVIAIGTGGEAASAVAALEVTEPAAEAGETGSQETESGSDEATDDRASRGVQAPTGARGSLPQAALAAVQPLPAAPEFWEPGRGVVDLSRVTFSSFGVVGTSGQHIEARLTDLADAGTQDGRRLQAWAVTSQHATGELARVDVIDGEAVVPWNYFSTEAEQSNQLTIRVGYAAEADRSELVIYESAYTYRTVPMQDNPVMHAPQHLSVRVGEPAEFVFTASGHPVPFVAAGQQFWDVTSADGVLVKPAELPEEWKNVFPDEQQPRNGEYHYRIAAVTPEMDGMTISAIYKNVGIFGNGQGKSPDAKLTVTGYEQPSDWRKPTVTKSPENVTVVPAEGTDPSEGTEVRLYAEGDPGNPAGTVRWQWNRGDGTWRDVGSDASSGALLGDTGRPMLRLWVSERHSGYSYRAVYSNRLGEAASDPARVIVQAQLGEGSYWGQSDPLVAYSVPSIVSLDDEFVTIGGRRWLDPSQKKTGSVVSVRIAGLRSDPAVHHPVTSEPVDTEIIAAVKASSTGRWLAEIPRSDALEVGKTYTVTIRSGELQSGDKVREETAQFTVEPAYELATITLDLPERLVVANTEPGATVAIGATAPTPITYRWEVRRAFETTWTPADRLSFVADGDTLTTPGAFAMVASSSQFTGGEVRVAMTTGAGTVYSQSSVIAFAADAAPSVSVDFDADRSYAYGDKVRITGTGFDPAQRSARVLVGPFMAAGRIGADGSFTVDIEIVGSLSDGMAGRMLEPGDYPVVVAGRKADDPFIVADEQVTVALDPSVTGPVVVRGFDAVTDIPEGEVFEFAPEISGENLQYAGYLFTGEQLRTGSIQGGQPWSGERQEITGDLAQWDEGKVVLVVWNAGGIVRLESEIDVIPADGSPSYPHVTGVSTAEDDDALVWVERDAELGSGKSVRISGKHWLDASGEAGSLIAVKLNFEHLNGQTGQYERTGDKIVLHPKNGTEDVTIWKLITADADGSFTDTIDLPEHLRAGQRLTATVTSGVFKDGDVSRSIVTPPLTVGGVAWDEDDAFAGVCEPSTERPTWSVQEQAELGGTLRISGQGWCHPTNGGSTIAIKIDDGSYSHLSDALNSNRTIWDIAYADDETGDWEVDVTLPDGTTSGPQGSSPALPEGEHSIRLLTGTLKEGDAIRTVGTPTGQNTSFVVGEYRPNALPNPIDIDGGQLTEANRNGVVVQQQAAPAPGQWLVTVPGGSEGDWVYIDAYAGSSSRGPFPKWYQLDAHAQVALSLAGVTLQTGDLTVTVQSGNQGAVGELLGWAEVTIAAPPKPVKPPVKPGPVIVTGQGGAAPQRAATGGAVSAAPQGAPATVPEQPVKRGSQLTKKNAGKVTGTISSGIVTLTVADGEPNQWIYAYVYTGVQVRPIGWVQLDAEKQVRVDISELPDGNHKIALVGMDGALIGWASATRGAITAAQLVEEQTAEAQAEDQGVADQANVAAELVRSTPAWMVNALLGGGAVLLLAAAIAVALAVRNRRNEE